MKHVLAVIGVAALCFSAACHKKVAAVKPVAPPQASTPAVQQPVQQATPTHTAESTPAPVRPRYPDKETQAKIDELISRIQDAYFDYDQHSLRSDAQSTLQSDAKTLGDIIRQYPDYKLTVEGHCDERGSEAYNLALGDARAKAAKEFLVNLGLPADQLQIISYGKERPVCDAHDEACWQKNRRAHIVAMARSNQ